MNELKEKLLSAINDIDFDKKICQNQKSTLEKALVMLRVEWSTKNLEYGRTTNLNSESNNPNWNWDSYTYSIIEPKKIVPLDFTDAEKLIGKAVKKKNQLGCYLVITANESGVTVGGFTYPYSYDSFCDKYTFLDGSPISKEV